MFKHKMKSKVLVAAFLMLMVSGFAHAGISNLTGTGTSADPYQMGLIGSPATVLAVTVTGASLSTFDEFANFSIGGAGQTSGSANSYTLNLGGINVLDITGLFVEVWNDSHPSGTTLIDSFLGDNTTHSFGSLAAGNYHLDISGAIGANALAGQYSVAITAVPEPETYAMLLVGLGLIGFAARRRKNQL